ncbi:hypothetical protein ZHAS_00003928 [Anopheles sinensis]|uniref:Uncharacterized protein n=1 Tax=Anopheles sinensis TaxID=74873 RepID=A0A084VFJ9_ANOSI|nr:hypothetical protein ZHAS_00003928 [Anopheles sinensis]
MSGRKQVGDLVGIRCGSELAWILSEKNGIVKLQTMDDTIVYRVKRSLDPVVYGVNSAGVRNPFESPVWVDSFESFGVEYRRYEKVSVWCGEYRGAEGVVIAISDHEVYMKLGAASNFAILCTPHYTIWMPEGGRRKRYPYISAVNLAPIVEADDEGE